MPARTACGGPTGERPQAARAEGREGGGGDRVPGGPHSPPRGAASGPERTAAPAAGRGERPGARRGCGSPGIPGPRGQGGRGTPETGWGVGAQAAPLTARGGRAWPASWARRAPRGQAQQARPAGRAGGAAARLSPGCRPLGSRPAATPRLRSNRRSLWSQQQPPAKWRRGGAGQGRGAAEPPAPAPARTHLPLRARPPPSGLLRGRGSPSAPAKLGEPLGTPGAPPRRPFRPPRSFYFPPPCVEIAPLLVPSSHTCFWGHTWNTECSPVVSPSSYPLFTQPDTEPCHFSVKISNLRRLGLSGLDVKALSPFLQLGCQVF